MNAREKCFSWDSSDSYLLQLCFNSLFFLFRLLHNIIKMIIFVTNYLQYDVIIL